MSYTLNNSARNQRKGILIALAEPYKISRCCILVSGHEYMVAPRKLLKATVML